MSAQAKARGDYLLALIYTGYFAAGTADLRAAIAVWKMWAMFCRENPNEHTLAMRERAQNDVRRYMA